MSTIKDRLSIVGIAISIIAGALGLTGKLIGFRQWVKGNPKVFWGVVGSIGAVVVYYVFFM